MKRLPGGLLFVIFWGCLVWGSVNGSIAVAGENDWKTASLESQGISSNLPSGLETRVKQEYASIRCLLIVRHGKLVYERYFQDCDQNSLQEVHSVTKSFTSALIGIALQEGYLKGVDRKITEFYPEYMQLKVDRKIKEVTIRHLLTMTSGRYGGWSQSGDMIGYSLGLTFIASPGQSFNYCNPDTHLLSGIISRTTHQSALEYARKNLFGPLGFTAVEWPADSNGYNFGPASLRLTARDMAKFGFLYLNLGKWNGKQVISADWVRESTVKHVKGGALENEDYGYLWWVTTVKGHTAYFAAGYGGQFIFVIPGLDLVVVITSTDDRPHIQNRNIIGEVIVPAVKTY
jgi:CubicO group peptidase (beta-lactamase class C family)